jgi:hypothetical protein
MIIREVAARAWLADPGYELDRARQRAGAGDPDWRLWVAEFDRGEAALMDMRVGVTVEFDDGSIEIVEVENHSIWFELLVQPPVLGAVIAEISSKDFEVLARRITERGGSITVSELEDMHVAVEIADDLRAALRPPATGTPRPGDIRARPGITTENA